MFARRSLIAGFTLIALALFSGCASYHLGSPTKLPFESIYIRPAANDSFAPQSQALLSGQIREAFIHDGRVKVLSNESDADAVLEVTITDYTRSSSARDSTDTVIARSFDLSLHATVSLYNNNQGDFFFQDRLLTDRTSAYIENPYIEDSDKQGFIQAEYQAMPRLARGLARKIADEVLSPWPSRAEEAAAARANINAPEAVVEN